MKKHYKIIKDKEYGYLRIEPLPSQEEVNRYYQEEFYANNSTGFNDSSLDVQEEEAFFLSQRWENLYLKCQEYFKIMEGKSVFDIGFGYAQALSYFQSKGLEVSGLEPSEEAVAYARSKGLNVFQSKIEDFYYIGKGKYDIVLLLNVLEHLRKPIDVLKNIREKILKRNGILIIDVPNEFNTFQIIANKEYNLNEWWVCPPNHINYFSFETLKEILEKSGYEIYYTEASFPLEIFMLMGEVYVGNEKLGKECHKRRVKFEYLMKKHGKQELLSKLYVFLAELGIGRQVLMYAINKY